MRQAVLRMLMLAAILVGINILAARYHTGLDLTKEKRFTLSAPTIKMLKSMDDVAVVTVYLKGQFPAGFQRLSDATRERLESFRGVAGSKIVFRFTDPFEGKNEEEKVAISKELSEKGIFAINLQSNEEDGYVEKWVFPYVLVQYRGKETAVNLLENNKWVSPWENLNNSENLLEYKLADAINKLNKPDKETIAYIVGHGEALGLNTYDLFNMLNQKYKVDTFDLSINAFIPKSYKAIIINRPTLPIDDREKFKIDQYVMEGGRILWAIDQLYTPLDSLQKSEQFMTLDYGLEIDDMLFKYGARINLDLIEDLQQCLPLPILVAAQKGEPQMQLRPWIFYPIFTPTSQHPIVKNISAVFGRFVNSIDTVNNTPGIQKTVLLQSSKYSRTEAFPVRVSLSMLRYQMTPDMFKKPYQNAAVLLEGKFNSLFQNRLAPTFLKILQDSLKRPFKQVADVPTKMIVISDGEMMENDFSQKDGPMEMGYWRFTETRFANKEFISNCLEYLTDDGGLLEARAKDAKLRMLDSGRVKEEKLKWRLVNIALPILLVLMFASAFIFFRKRKYEKK